MEARWRMGARELRESASLAQRAAFVAGMLLLAVSLLAGLAEAVRMRGRPPFGSSAYLSDAHAFLDAGDIDAALREYRAASLVLPVDAVTTERLAAALTRAGRGSEALDLLEQAAAGNVGAEFLLHYGVALGDAGRLDEAGAAFARAVAVGPDFAPAHVLLGWYLGGRGELEAAAASFERALELNPGSQRARAGLDAVRARMREAGASAADPAEGKSAGAAAVSGEAAP